MSEPVVLSSAVRAIRPTDQLSEALNEIAQLQELEDDWDLDGAHRIDPVAIRFASRLVCSVEELAWQEGVNWQIPDTGPVPDGSVALTWEGNGRQALMVFRPGVTPVVECVTREDGKPPVQ